MEPIVMYSTNWCGYCRAARALLKQKGLVFTEIDVGADESKRQEMIQRSGRHTVPQIFFGDKHIGGFTDLYAYFESQA